MHWYAHMIYANDKLTEKELIQTTSFIIAINNTNYLRVTLTRIVNN